MQEDQEMLPNGAVIEPPRPTMVGNACRPRPGQRRPIRAWCREALGFLLRFTGASWIIRRFVCRNRATVLVYHDPSPEVFDKHLAYLAARYTFIPLRRLVQAVQDRDWSDMPANPLVVTIDDGHRGNYQLLKSIRRWKLRPTIYLCSDIVNTRRHFWWKAGYERPQKLKKLPHQDLLDMLRSETGFELEKEYVERQSLSLSEIREMAPDVEFGSHTRFHPILVNCTDETCREEIVRSKQRLEGLLGCPVTEFSYTNGEHTERERQFVAAAQYQSARTVDIGWNALRGDRLRLRAMPVDDDASINVLCGQTCGIFGRIYSWFQRGRQTATTKKRDEVRVLMLGPEPHGSGGMGTVVQHILDYDFASAGVRLRFLRSDHGLSAPRKVLYFLRAVCGLAICGLGRRADLVHIHTCSKRPFLQALVCMLIARAFRMPVVMHIHAGSFAQYVRRFRTVKLSLLNCCAAILVVNDHLREIFDGQPYRDRVRVLYNMLPDRPGVRRQPPDGNGTPAVMRIIFLGRFVPLKGCPELLQAFRAIHSARSDVRLVMAGSGCEWKAARRFVEENHLREVVDLPGWVGREAKERLLDKADIMVLPSSCEAFPMVILVAMQRALPVVTVARPGVETQVTDGETGIIAPSPAPEHLAAALLELIDNPHLRRQYGAAGRRRFLERFTADVLGPELVQIYRTCAAGSRATLSRGPTTHEVCGPCKPTATGASTCDNS
jgi:glycosyltransferase involved in cell wall biosynthesis